MSAHQALKEDSAQGRLRLDAMNEQPGNKTVKVQTSKDKWEKLDKLCRGSKVCFASQDVETLTSLCNIPPSIPSRTRLTSSSQTRARVNMNTSSATQVCHRDSPESPPSYANLFPSERDGNGQMELSVNRMGSRACRLPPFPRFQTAFGSSPPQPTAVPPHTSPHPNRRRRPVGSLLMMALA